LRGVRVMTATAYLLLFAFGVLVYWLAGKGAL
jgi:hypothetical protein